MSIEDARRDPVVIVSAVRTPMGGFQGDLATATAPELGAAAIRAALERAGLAPELDRGSHHGLRAAGRAGPGAGAPGALGAGFPKSVGCTTDQQDVRLRHEGGDAGPRPDRGRHQRHHGRRRHGEHDQRALPAARGARRLPHGPRPGARPHVPRRPGGRLRQGPPDGHLRRGLRASSTSSRARRRTRSPSRR